MTLINTIRDDQLTARKAKNSIMASLLTTLIGEAVMIGKNDGNRETTDLEVTSVIKKFIKNIDDTITVLSKTDPTLVGPVAEKVTALFVEKGILELYLPKQLTKEQLVGIIDQLIASGEVSRVIKSKGFVMKYIKDNYAGEYDGKVAAQAVDEALNA